MRLLQAEGEMKMWENRVLARSELENAGDALRRGRPAFGGAMSLAMV